MNKIHSNKQIRFGLMCESPTLKAWEAECINQALGVENTKLELLIYPAQKSFQKKRSLIERALVKSKCYSPVDFSKRFKDIPFITCTTEKKNSSEYFSIEDIDKIKNANLNFILIFSGFDNIDGEILNFSKYGIWSYHHGDIEKYRGSPACFWEIYNNEIANGVVLQKFTTRDDEVIILKNGYFKLFNYSYKKTLDYVYFKSAGWLKDICTSLISNTGPYLNNMPTRIEAIEYSKPNSIEFLKFSFKLFKNKLRIFLNNFFVEQWNIGYVDMSIKDLVESDDVLKINWRTVSIKKRIFC